MINAAEYTVEENRRLSPLELLIQAGRQEGRQEGILEGRQEGRQEGILEGVVIAHRNDLLDDLVEQFGSVPKTVQNKVLVIADAQKLKRLRKAIPGCKTMREFSRML